METVRISLSFTPPGRDCASGVPMIWMNAVCGLVTSSVRVAEPGGDQTPMNISSNPNVVSRPQIGGASPGPREFRPYTSVTYCCCGSKPLTGALLNVRNVVVVSVK